MRNERRRQTYGILIRFFSSLFLIDSDVGPLAPLSFFSSFSTFLDSLPSFFSDFSDDLFSSFLTEACVLTISSQKRTQNENYYINVPKKSIYSLKNILTCYFYHSYFFYLQNFLNYSFHHFLSSFLS